MFSTLKKILCIRTTNHAKKCTEMAPLFSGSAYFSNRVPNAFSEKWVAHGGEISSGTALDVRARYFFATDPSEPWVTKLFSKSVMVIHAGWIMHCVDQAFQVPISEYILDGRFIPWPPYKLTGDFAPPIYVPLSEPGGPTDREPGTGPTPVQTSDTPSTPMSIPRKRNREQAYFDSPSGSLVFSGFDKDGMPRRPRKQRKLRFDPSFSPESGRSGRGAVQGAGPDCHRDHHGASWDDDEIRDKHKLDAMVVSLSGCLTAPRPPDTPDKPLTNRKPPTTHPHLSVDEYLSNSPAISINKQGKIPPVRTIDFSNPPPPTRRFPFPVADTTKSGDTGMMLSVVKSTDHKVKTPKKISFANHARVCVYVISPQRPDTKGDVGAGPAQHASNQRSEDGPEVDGKTQISSDEVKDSDDSTAEATQDLGLRTSTPKINDDRPWLHSGDQSRNATLTLTMEEVQRMRRHLLDLAETNGISDGQLATSFELGMTYRGMAFNHVW